MAWDEPPRVRTVAAWALSAACSPRTSCSATATKPRSTTTRADTGQARQLEIVSVKPSDPYPGSSLIVSYDGAVDPAALHVYAAKIDLPVVARRAGSMVARLPADIAAGDVEGAPRRRRRARARRAAIKRSKAYHVRVKPIRWHKILRDLAGGFALLVLGIVRSRAVRAKRPGSAMRASWRARCVAAGPRSGSACCSAPRRSRRPRLRACSAGLVSSSLIAVAPRGAGVPRRAARRGGRRRSRSVVCSRRATRSMLVAFGVLWSALARARRARAFARLLLGAGLIAYGLQGDAPERGAVRAASAADVARRRVARGRRWSRACAARCSAPVWSRCCRGRCR